MQQDEDAIEAGARRDAEVMQSQLREDAEHMETRFREDPRQVREWLRQNNLIYGGLIGIGVIIMQPFLTAPSLDAPATISVVAFALAIRSWRPSSCSTRRRHFAGARPRHGSSTW